MKTQYVFTRLASISNLEATSCRNVYCYRANLAPGSLGLSSYYIHGQYYTSQSPMPRLINKLHFYATNLHQLIFKNIMLSRFHTLYESILFNIIWHVATYLNWTCWYRMTCCVSFVFRQKTNQLIVTTVLLKLYKVMFMLLHMVMFVIVWCPTTQDVIPILWCQSPVLCMDIHPPQLSSCIVE